MPAVFIRPLSYPALPSQSVSSVGQEGDRGWVSHGLGPSPNRSPQQLCDTEQVT